MSKFTDVASDVGGFIGDVIEIGGDTLQNNVKLEQAKVDRINTNNEIAIQLANDKLAARREQRALLKNSLFFIAGLIALYAILKALQSAGVVKNQKS